MMVCRDRNRTRKDIKSKKVCQFIKERNVKLMKGKVEAKSR